MAAASHCLLVVGQEVCAWPCVVTDDWFLCDRLLFLLSEFVHGLFKQGLLSVNFIFGFINYAH